MEICIEPVAADLKRVRAALEAYPKRAERASVRALNRAGKSGKSLLARKIAKDMGLKVGDISGAISLRKATASCFFVLLSASLERIPLIKFKAKATKRGVSYRIGSKRTKLSHAFIARMPTGHEGVFMRDPGAGRRGPAPHYAQLPITERRGPSIGRVFLKYSDEALARAQEQFPKDLEHELRFAFGGGGSS